MVESSRYDAWVNEAEGVVGVWGEAKESGAVLDLKGGDRCLTRRLR